MSERTRVIVVAHLFGGRVDLSRVVNVARRHGLLLVEDCAQALSSRHDSGDARADVSMFSFGLLKTATAAGGGVLHIRNPELLREMRLRHDRWPEQGNRAYAGRLVRAAALVELSRPRPYAVLAAGCRAAGGDLDALVHSRTRSFRSATTADLARQLEWRPARALAAMVAHRQATIDEDRIERRRLAGEEALGRLPAGVVQPGWAMPERTHWLFPVVAPDPDALVARARAAGFDAARAASNLVAVAAPAGCDELEPVRARAIVSSLVYLPMYPEIPARDRARLLEALELGAARANAA